MKKSFWNTFRVFLALANTACAGQYLTCMSSDPEGKPAYFFFMCFNLVIATSLIIGVER